MQRNAESFGYFFGMCSKHVFGVTAMNQSHDPYACKKHINSAKEYILERNFGEAKSTLLKAIAENVESPVTYNLFGAFTNTPAI